MQDMFLDWLMADFSIFGLRIQYWMPMVFFVFVIFFVFSNLDLRRFRK
jgi:hypothetical protein